jgi:hypothetical protein
LKRLAEIAPSLINYIESNRLMNEKRPDVDCCQDGAIMH